MSSLNRHTHARARCTCQYLQAPRKSSAALRAINAPGFRFLIGRYFVYHARGDREICDRCVRANNVEQSRVELKRISCLFDRGRVDDSATAVCFAGEIMDYSATVYLYMNVYFEFTRNKNFFLISYFYIV